MKYESRAPWKRMTESILWNEYDCYISSTRKTKRYLLSTDPLAFGVEFSGKWRKGWSSLMKLIGLYEMLHRSTKKSSRTPRTHVSSKGCYMCFDVSGVQHSRQGLPHRQDCLIDGRLTDQPSRKGWEAVRIWCQAWTSGWVFSARSSKRRSSTILVSGDSRK